MSRSPALQVFIVVGGTVYGVPCGGRRPGQSINRNNFCDLGSFSVPVFLSIKQVEHPDDL